MVSGDEISGVFRIARVRFRDAAGQGAILVGELLDEQGRAIDRTTLRIPSGLSNRATPFHVAQSLQVRGREARWRDPRTGIEERQVAVTEWHEVRPHGANWIDYVAGSPTFGGIGRSTAQMVWDCVGNELFSLLALGSTDRLVAAVPSLGADRARALIDAWAASGQDRLIQWLDEHRLPRKLVIAVLRAYANQGDAVARLTADPYRLLAFGLSWKRVDEIARGTLAVADDDPRRLHAAVVEALMAAYNKGHTAATAQTLTSAVMHLLNVDESLSASALKLVFRDGGFVRAGEDLFQLRGVYAMEKAIAMDLAYRCDASPASQQKLRWEAGIEDFERCHKAAIRLTARQRAAVANALSMPLSVIVGGAGTGKTACLAALHHAIEYVEAKKDAVLQMALAGRAAKRMREATGRDAVTIAGFLHVVEADRIAQASHVLIDEASMLDVPSFYAVLRRLRGRAKVVLVGDEFQLPPVGSGKILHLLTQQQSVPVTTLDKVWRQEDGNSIRTVATAVRTGTTPEVSAFDGATEGVSIIDSKGDAAEVARSLFEQLGGLDEKADVCVLTPRRRNGPGNALAINSAIHRAHFSAGQPVVGAAGDTGFCVGDRFVCDVNHWDVDLMNGSLGLIKRLATNDEIAAAVRDEDNGSGKSKGVPVALVEIDGSTRLLSDAHLLSCSWGYALTCHRAQGSDFDRVIVVLDETVDRSWLYTAITRGRRQVVLIGTPPQLNRIIRTAPRVNNRLIGLDVFLSRALATETVCHG